jgi:hypothetical protein
MTYRVQAIALFAPPDVVVRLPVAAAGMGVSRLRIIAHVCASSTDYLNVEWTLHYFGTRVELAEQGRVSPRIWHTLGRFSNRLRQETV